MQIYNIIKKLALSLTISAIIMPTYAAYMQKSEANIEDVSLPLGSSTPTLKLKAFDITPKYLINNYGKQDLSSNFYNPLCWKYCNDWFGLDKYDAFVHNDSNGQLIGVLCRCLVWQKKYY